MISSTINSDSLLADVAYSRSGLYQLLTRVYQREVDTLFLQQLRQKPFFDALYDSGVNIGDLLETKNDDELIEILSEEFTRLFIGPGPHVSPHESVFRDDGDGRLWNRHTITAKKFIESSGLAYPTSNKYIPDHISVELEFMHAVSILEADSWRQHDSEFANWFISIQKQFLEQHLSHWVTNFCNEVIKLSRHTFYAEMANLTRDFIYKESMEII